jgi:hypothetical protein
VKGSLGWLCVGIMLIACACAPTERPAAEAPPSQPPTHVDATSPTSTTTVSLEEVRPLLGQLANLIPHGFGEREVDQVAQQIEQLSDGEGMAFEYHIDFDREHQHLHIQAVREGEAVELTFRSDAAGLVDQIHGLEIQ